MQLEKYDEAIQHYKQLQIDYPDSPLRLDAVRGTATAWFRQGRYEEALRLTKKLSKVQTMLLSWPTVSISSASLMTTWDSTRNPVNITSKSSLNTPNRMKRQTLYMQRVGAYTDLKNMVRHTMH